MTEPQITGDLTPENQVTVRFSETDNSWNWKVTGHRADEAVSRVGLSNKQVVSYSQFCKTKQWVIDGCTSRSLCVTVNDETLRGRLLLERLLGFFSLK
jgi:hypothetical protein